MDTEGEPVAELALVVHAPPAPSLLDTCLSSCIQFNVEQMPVYLVVSAEDYETAFEHWGDQVSVLDDPHLSRSDLTWLQRRAISRLEPTLIRAKSLIAVGGDVRFIRPLVSSDFLAADGHPFEFASEEAELRVDPSFRETLESAHSTGEAQMRELLGVTAWPLRRSRSLLTMSTVQIRALGRFLADRGMSIEDAVRMWSDELDWYSAWTQRDLGAQSRVREPLVKQVSTSGQLLSTMVQRQSDVDLARGYVAVAGEFSRRIPASDARDLPSVAALVGRNVTIRTLLSAASLRLLRRAPRVQRALSWMKSGF